jgi:hypothetical protein
MAHSNKKDSKLDEVRAVLRRLQGLPTEDEPDPLEAARFARGVRLLAATSIGITVVGIAGGAYLLTSVNQPVTSASGPKPAGASEKAPGAGPPDSRAKDQQVAATTVASPQAEPKAGGGSRPPPLSPPNLPAAAVASEIKPTVDAALDLMAKGRIRAARERLLALTDGGLPPADLAWALARSYDPNHLVTLPAPDAAPDVKEATRWYRLWYGAAVRQGLVADSVSLERIIGSMRE